MSFETAAVDLNDNDGELYNLPSESDDPIHLDDKIQTILAPDYLNRRGRELYREHILSVDERGVNDIHVAFGFIEWFESASSEIPRLAPLLLLPVNVERKPYRVSAEVDEGTLNLSLKEKLKEQDIHLPDFCSAPEVDEETIEQEGVDYLADTPIEHYFTQVEEALSEHERVNLKRFITFGRFSFRKAALYQDLDPELWGDKSILNDELLRTLMAAYERSDTNQSAGGNEQTEEEASDSQSAPTLVFDADSSQYQVIKHAVMGENLVVQGPPGTGKSQTIANMISAFIAEDKRVLFVAEKKAALDVVSSRLRNAGLGPLLLELHERRHPREMIENLRERVEADTPKSIKSRIRAVEAKLKEYEQNCEDYAEYLMADSGFAGETVYEFIGNYISSQHNGPVDEISAINIEHVETKEQLQQICGLRSQFAELEANETDLIHGLSNLPENVALLKKLKSRINEIVEQIEAEIKQQPSLKSAQLTPNSDTLDFLKLCLVNSPFKTFSSSKRLASDFAELVETGFSTNFWQENEKETKRLEGILELLRTLGASSTEELLKFRERNRVHSAIKNAGLIHTKFQNYNLPPEEIGERLEFDLRVRHHSNHIHRFETDGSGHKSCDDFRELDKDYLSQSVFSILHQQLGKDIPKGARTGKVSTWSELAHIKHQMTLQKNHRPVRTILSRAHKAISVMKPVWMMSPLAVPEYLPRELDQFDVVIIDEASQMLPEDALSAIIRAKQLVVVGDKHQLPPTNFFNSQKAVDEDEEPEDLESILDLADIIFPENNKTLRWHYRSKHSDLVKFSNHHIYNDRLILMPPHAHSEEEKPLEYRYVDKAVYKSGENCDEAHATIDAIEETIRSHPDKSIAVVTMNSKQRQFIEDEFDMKADFSSEIQDYREAWRETPEKFVIRNLENIQGDERDIIIVSTVYGPDENGNVAQRFGPINGNNGHRRLNVLFTRAKEKVVVVSSLKASDINLNATSSAGVRFLKGYLEFLNTGIIGDGKPTGESDSPFEDAVAKRLRQSGFIVEHQIGESGFKIDLGIRHQDFANGFIAGVECDGATYHSSRYARERDRLRQEILEGRGWQIFRVWSTDWFNHPERETEKLCQKLYERLESLN